MTQTQAQKFGTMTRQPSAWQFIADELPMLILCLAGFLASGLEDTTLNTLLLWVCVIVEANLAYKFIYLKKTRYIITDSQLIHEHGLFHRTRDYIELYRVIDFREESRFLQQLCGIKTISVFSGDRTTPRLDLVGIEADDPLIPAIRERVNYNRQNNSIYEITNR